MKFVAGTQPCKLSTDELVACRARTRQAIKVIENRYPLTFSEADELRVLRAYLRELVRECGKRFIQERLF